MNKKLNYNSTLIASFIGYIVQAIVNNFLPLLFIIIQDTYHVTLANITLLVTVNFGVQLITDLVSVSFIDRIGYKMSVILAHALAGIGLVLLAFLPEYFSNPFIGFLIPVVIYAIGGGLLEVLISPIVEALPTSNKEKAMSLLHSFYCFGHVIVVLITTIFFLIFGTKNWQILALIFALIPISNMFYFMKAPIRKLNEDHSKELKVKDLIKKKIFWLFVLLMITSGASEQSVSQWASKFVQDELGLNKIYGDLLGPMLFATMMGISRFFYGKYGEKVKLERFMYISAFLAVISYLMISIIPSPIIGLIGFSICGLSVGIMWPGTFSIASKEILGAGTSMFALLALAGDLGASLGPTVVGMVASTLNDNLKLGILAAIIFPIGVIVLLVGKNRIIKKLETV
ncbi:MFS transporter [Haploplasma axanthum]|uniref:Putative sialic acid transporter n=1 Tax=Haploplasma axanthum TaxID=29552 RepID=A0A449BDE1_HAPAX|nr:MFS transporter [Haploplasma axanthum]VEU80437.1 putative sialic acid transporter [Haploplasma axanthum]